MENAKSEFLIRPYGSIVTKMTPLDELAREFALKFMYFTDKVTWRNGTSPEAVKQWLFGTFAVRLLASQPVYDGEWMEETIKQCREIAEGEK